MKKKVRIYKAPDGKGKFVNKTAKFLHKAQEGGQQDQQAQITDYVYKTLANTDELDMEMMKDTLIGELVSAKIPMDQAEQIVENIAANFESQEPVQEQEEEMDVYDEGLAELQRQQEEAEEERLAALSEDYGYYDDTAADGEDDEDDDDDDDIPEEIYMQQGGDIIPEDNAVSFTGYYPFQYNRDKQTSYQQGGITKRKYIGQVMKLLKKQAGGEEEKPSAGFDPTDTMDNKKKNKNDNFVAALANSAQEAKMKEQAEAMWEQQQQQMMQQQAPMQQQQFAQNGAEIGGGDIIYGATEEEKEEWRRNNGPNYYPEMSISQVRRMSPRGFSRNQMRSFAGMVPQGGFFPMGMNIMTYPQMVMPEQKPIHVQGTLPGMKLDVRKSHWLTGRPSQYSIEFGGDFAIPGFNMMPGKGYGYKSSNRKTIEGVSRLVNKAADPGKNNNIVLNNNPEYDKDGNGVPDNVQSNLIPSTPGIPSAYDRNANNMLDVTEVKTNLPAVNKNPNKNAVGKGPNVPTKAQTKKTVTATKSKQAGQTKPAASSAKVTNKGKVTVTTQPTKAPAKAPVNISIPNWMKSVVDNNRARDAANYKMINDFMNSKSPLLNQQSGGFVDSSNPDLYKFVYGGDDVITQQDMNYSDSRNTGSPFFAHGGLVEFDGGGKVTEYDKDGNGIPDLVERTPGKNPEEKKEEKKKDEPKKPEFQAITSKEDYDKRLAEERKKWQEDYTKQNQSSDDVGGYDPYGGYVRRSYRPNAFGRYFPANTVRRLGTWSQQQGMPYNPMTGAAFTGAFGPNTNLTKIDVRKSGWLSGRPKKYTMYFNNYNVDPKLAAFLESTSGAKPGTQPSSTPGYSNTPSTETMNKTAKNAKEFFGYTDAEWDKMSDKEKKQEKVNWKRQKYWESLPDPEKKEKEDSETVSGPSAEEITARDAATEANKNVIRNFSEVEGVQDDPFGIGTESGTIQSQDASTGTVSSDNPYKQDAAAAARGEGLFDPNSVNIPSDFLGEDAESLERNALTADAEEEIMNQEAMRRNPMFMGSSGAPAANPNFGALPEIATGQDYQLSDREKAEMDYMMQNRRSAPVDFQPYVSRKPSENLANLAYTDSLPALPAIPLEGGNYEDMLLSGFPQYTDAFEGAASNDEQYLPETMDDMSEGSVRNREIAAKQKYDQQQAAIRQQQLLQQQQATQNESRSGAALKEKAFNSNRQGVKGDNWTSDWDIKGVINKNKNQLETLKDSPIGTKTAYAIEKRWENLSNAQRKKYKSFNNFLKTEGYDKFYNAVNSKQSGGNANLNRFVYGDEVTKTSTGTDSPVSNTNNPINPFLRYDSAGKLVIPGFGEPEENKNQDLKTTLNYYEGYGQGDEFSAAPAGSASTMDESGNEIVMSPDEARKRIAENEFAVDFKNKDTYEVDAQGMLLSGNAGARGILDFFERRAEKRRNKNFNDRFTADNLYASDPSRDRGDYETNTGLYRPNEQGQIWNSRSKQLGGFMQEGGYVEGDVVDMTPEEIEEFIANGGEVEIIS